MRMNRRELIKAQAVAAAAAAGGMTLPAAAQNVVTERNRTEIKWSKAACRFCGTGCSVMVGTKAGHVVATHGDVKAEVNRGLNCVKGYFLSKIMYGRDRLTPFSSSTRLNCAAMTSKASSHVTGSNSPSLW